MRLCDSAERGRFLDGLIALVVLAALAIPAAAIAGFFMALGARNRLSQVESRLTALEGGLARAARAAEVAALSGLVAAPRPTPTAAPPPSEPEKEAEPIEAAAPPEQAPGEPPASVPEAAVSAVSAPPPRSPPPPTAAAEPEPSFEERLGTRWVVWVGGVALALGAVFLVRYTIEQGLIGPGV